MKIIFSKSIAPLILLCSVLSCDLEKIDQNSGSLNARFSFPPGLIYEKCPVTFSNLSTGANSYLWDFGDGMTSMEAAPAHAFTSSGIFNVRLTAQNASNSNDTTIQITVYQTQQFKKTFFPGTGTNIGYSVLLASNDGYIMAGRAHTAGAVEKAYLAKTDGNGTILWQFQFGNGNYQEANAVIPVTGGGYLVVGTISSPLTMGEDIFLIKTDANGNSQWERPIGSEAGNDDYGYAVVQLSSGAFVVCGESSQNFFIVGCDSGGNKSWEKSINKSNQDYLTSILVTSDNKLLVSGSTGTGNDNNLYLAKLEPTNGAVIWEKTYGGSNYETGGKLILLSDGNYLLTGSSNSTVPSNAAYLVKVDPNGNKIWEKHIGASTWGSAAAEAMDGTIGITGYTSNLCAGGECPNLYLAKVSSTGTLIWEKGVGTTGYQQGVDIKSTPDCGFVAIGSSTTAIYLVKTDKDGN